ncbi:portal protein [Synechococcus virus S-ESS1]|uniref:Portal protein n=1 Tax=Synechococcus virus S-ESS1 TaxID=1964565 RepID=A0A1V0DX15_9CAUD|nr:portal protein [Synechococcus virus S-ESS1]ARB05693.1 portal protein [Synechococcus virus S-ESS1]
MKVSVLNDPDMAEVARDIEQLVGPRAREMAFSGAYDSAARFSKQIDTWSPPLQSADADILPEKSLLDARSRDLGRNDAYIAGGEQLHKDAIVGHMYMLNAKPSIRILGWDESRAEEFQEEVEAKFQVWADSPHNWVDARRKHDLTELIRLAVGVFVYGGEVLATCEWIDTKRREFRTAIQMIDPDRLETPYTEMGNPNVKGGIKFDSYGGAVSAFIRTRHPREYMRNLAYPDMLDFKEVGFQKPWGRQQVIHIINDKRVDQSRAVSDIASSLRELAITKKFRDVTLQNAVVNATYAASIESELPSEVVFQQMGQGSSAGNAVTNYAEDYLAAVGEYVASSKNMKIDGVRIPHLFPGTKLKMQPAGTPGGVGQDFETSLLRYIAVALNVSYEELSRDYSKTNYSSARAAMTQTWRFMQSRKKIVADKMANYVYRLWLEEAINADQIESFRARDAGLLYTNGHQNLMFDALTGADWIGASRGQIDELKETQAAVLRIKYGLSTHEDELSRLGKDWRKVYVQLEREAKERELRHIELYEDNSVNAASGTTREADSDEKEAGDDKEE